MAEENNEQLQQEIREKLNQVEPLPSLEEEGLIDKIRNFFEESEIDFIRVFGCFFLVVLLVIGGFFAFNFFFSGESGSDVDNDISIEDLLEEDANVPVITGFIFGFNDGDKRFLLTSPQINLSYLIGENLVVYESKSEIPFIIAYEFGVLGTTPETNFALKILLLSDLLEINNTRIFDFLDRFEDRRQALDDYMSEFSSLRDEAFELANDLNEEVDILKINLNRTEAERNRLEADFFNALDNLRHNESAELLAQFNIKAQEALNYKIELSARNVLLSLYQQLLSAVDLKIAAIDENRDALIKGVKVTVIEGEDLDLVIQK